MCKQYIIFNFPQKSTRTLNNVPHKCNTYYLVSQIYPHNPTIILSVINNTDVSIFNLSDTINSDILCLFFSENI